MSQIFWKMNLRQPDPVKHEPLSLEDASSRNDYCVLHYYAVSRFD